MIVDSLSVIIRDFHMDELTKTRQSITLQNFMKKYNFKLVYKKIIFVNDTQIDHIWINSPTKQCFPK
jgi:hypothetical protein